MTRTLATALLMLTQSVTAAPPDARQMACIPAGEFRMGDALDGMANAMPVHVVHVDEFFIDRGEVPGPLWEAVRNWGTANGYGFDDARGGQHKSRVNGEGNFHPIQTVSWYDAVKWCNARSEREGLKPCYYIDYARTRVYRGGQEDVDNGMVDWNANGYRLPTEAEWEKAARGGLIGKRFPWGDDEGNAPRNANFQRPGNPFMFGDQPWTAPVGSFLANGYGLYDMAGNVMEWTWDVYDADGYQQPGNKHNPAGPEIIGKGNVPSRSLRGGLDRVRDINNCRCAIRTGMNPGQKHMYFGFRTVRRDTPQVAAPEAPAPEPPPSDEPAKTVAPAAPAGMVYLPGGSYQRGDSLDGLAKANPVKEITVEALFADEAEVSQSLWQAVVEYGKSHGYTIEGGKARAADHPVHSVSWHDAIKWCNARSEMEGLIPCYHTDAGLTVVYKTGRSEINATMVKWQANGYRLPTEAEWEMAARGGLSGKRFPWGNLVGETKKANFCFTGNPARATGSPPYTAVVKTWPANEFGLFDMAGNLAEWTWDHYHTDYYKSAADKNPKGPESGATRTVRGGSWDSDAADCRCASRLGVNPANADTTIGFRTVRTPAKGE